MCFSLRSMRASDPSLRPSRAVNELYPECVVKIEIKIKAEYNVRNETKENMLSEAPLESGCAKVNNHRL